MKNYWPCILFLFLLCRNHALNTNSEFKLKEKSRAVIHLWYTYCFEAMDSESDKPTGSTYDPSIIKVNTTIVILVNKNNTCVSPISGLDHFSGIDANSLFDGTDPSPIHHKTELKWT